MISRLWATKVSTKTSVLLAETPGLLAAPTWSPDGHGLAFVRMVPTTPGRGTFEVVTLLGASQRVILSEPIDDWAHEASRINRLGLSFSPDGRFLAAPRIHPAGLAVVRTDTSRIMKTIESACFPAWSGDSSRLLYVSSGDEDRLESLDRNFGAAKQLVDLGQVDGPPLIARDGLSALVLVRKRIERGAAPPGESAEIWRVRVDDGRKELLFELGKTSGDQVLTSTSFTIDRDGENILSTFVIKGQPSQITWYRPKEKQVYKRFPVLDMNLMIDDVSLAPQGGTLAMRLGSIGPQGLPLLCELDTLALTPLAPNATIKAAWASRVLTTIEPLIRELRPSPIVSGRAIDRPVALPIPGEIDTNSEGMIRLRRIGRFGHELCKEMPAKDGWPEISFLFDYLREDFPAALGQLETIEAQDGPADRRLRLLNLRGQIFAGLNDYERAKGTFGYLKSIEPQMVRRTIETSSEGVRISKTTPPGNGWAEYAIRKVTTIEAEAAKEEAKEKDEAEAEGPIKPTDHRNPDAPAPGLGLDPDLPKMFKPFRPADPGGPQFPVVPGRVQP
jgi:hypothetical protein